VRIPDTPDVGPLTTSGAPFRTSRYYLEVRRSHGADSEKQRCRI
jgi:hypothetical protein